MPWKPPLRPCSAPSQNSGWEGSSELADAAPAVLSESLDALEEVEELEDLEEMEEELELSETPCSTLLVFLALDFLPLILRKQAGVNCCCL